MLQYVNLQIVPSMTPTQVLFLESETLASVIAHEVHVLETFIENSFVALITIIVIRSYETLNH